MQHRGPDHARGEADRVDDERVALPSADRITHLAGLDALGMRIDTDGNDPRRIHRFVIDHDVPVDLGYLRRKAWGSPEPYRARTHALNGGVIERGIECLAGCLAGSRDRIDARRGSAAARIAEHARANPFSEDRAARAWRANLAIGRELRARLVGAAHRERAAVRKITLAVLATVRLASRRVAFDDDGLADREQRFVDAAPDELHGSLQVALVDNGLTVLVDRVDEQQAVRVDEVELPDRSFDSDEPVGIVVRSKSMMRESLRGQRKGEKTGQCGERQFHWSRFLSEVSS